MRLDVGLGRASCYFCQVLTIIPWSPTRENAQPGRSKSYLVIEARPSVSPSGQLRAEPPVFAREGVEHRYHVNCGL